MQYRRDVCKVHPTQAQCLTIEVPKKARKNSSKNTFAPTAFIRSGPLKNCEYSVLPTGVNGITSQDADVRASQNRLST